MKIFFPGGLRVDAIHGGLTIRTDQPIENGGSGLAASPFDLFLASIGTCAGFYALRFCQQRDLETEGLALSLSFHRDATGKHVDTARIEVTLPYDFPEKYREAMLRAIDQCTVKRHLASPPEIAVTLIEPDADSRVEQHLAWIQAQGDGSPAGVPS